MMAQEKEVDVLTGTETTGHEWDGIRELNTPLPKWWLWVFYATIVFAIIYTILYPAWPWFNGFTHGILGYSSRAAVRERIEDMTANRAHWVEQIEATPMEEIVNDPDLLQIATVGGRAIFANNCAPCHGTGATGRPGGYPALVDDDWLWGGTLDAIHTTVTHGIRNGTDPDARASEMPAFGADGVLSPQQISAVAEHVLALSGAGPDNAEGAQIFAENCVACHGDLGRGNEDLGAPNLSDQIWLYGGSKDDIVRQVTKPRHGVMPPWHARLSEVEIKQVTVYVHSLGGGQ
jgi:cytochrome c oxidase cbb3-type subunit 3